MLCTACGAQNHSGSFCTNCGNRLARAVTAQRPVAQPVGQPASRPDVRSGRRVDALPVPAAPTHEPIIQRSRGARGTVPEVYLALQKSEAAVLHAASRIFSAYVAAGQVDDRNEAEMLAKSVRNAIRMAVYTDKLVQSDEEEN